MSTFQQRIQLLSFSRNRRPVLQEACLLPPTRALSSSAACVRSARVVLLVDGGSKPEYLLEMERYRQSNCTSEDKNRPLVK